MPRPLFIRARMLDSGHEFDTPEDSVWIKRGLAKRVKPNLYPPHADPIPPKYRNRELKPAATSAAESESTTTLEGE